MGGREQEEARMREGEAEGEKEVGRYFAISWSRWAAVTQLPDLVRKSGSRCCLCWGTHRGHGQRVPKDILRDFLQVPPQSSHFPNMALTRSQPPSLHFKTFTDSPLLLG